MFKRKLIPYLLLFILALGIVFSCKTKEEKIKVLVFSKTSGFRHIDAIDAGIAAIKKIGIEKGIEIDTTENAEKFTDDNLKQYRAVVFMNASGEVFTAKQRTAFQRFIQAGGGFMAVHAPTDAERTWPWYGQLLGGYFLSHPSNPNVQKGTYEVKIKGNPVTDSLPARFEREDEFYDFTIVNPDINVLVSLDETTYRGGRMGQNHPAVWFHEFEGGRSFYMAMGHTIESYTDPLFLKIFTGGLEYVSAYGKNLVLDYSRSVPEENRFLSETLIENMDEPMQMAFAEDGRIFIAERRGQILTYHPDSSKTSSAGRINVSSRYEDGLLGIALDPGFKTNSRLYFFYSATDGGSFIVSRFTLDNKGFVDASSEKKLLSIPKDILDGSHTGGALLFDPRGTGDLYITVGDNSSPRNWIYSPIDERKGMEDWDAQRSSANTNDLRGKILRIHPEDDGSYSIPDGNLFAKGLANTKAEIYTMGHRQPWRISMDTKTGWLYVGEVGPDANVDSAGIGPMGYDEFNQVRKAGNFGWPYFVANNKAYSKHNFVTGEKGLAFDPLQPLNSSPNNTGLQDLPPAQPAMIYYPYSSSKEFPLAGTGGRSATGGPIFRKTGFKNGKSSFPDYYEGKWFITDWIRCWINVVSMDSAGNYKSMESFVPGSSFSNPVDMQFGPDGSLYVLEYGKGWFRSNPDARLVKITYQAENRRPIAKITAAKKSSAVPFNPGLSAEKSIDYDGDQLKYQWTIILPDNNKEQSDQQKPEFNFKNPGRYQVSLTVTDAKGMSANAETEIIAGNEPPLIDIDILAGNSSFYFPGSELKYKISVSDKDGGLADQSVKPDVQFEFIPGTANEVVGDPDPDNEEQIKDNLYIFGGMVLNSSDCYSCHSIDKPSIGPTFNAIAEKYKQQQGATEYLTNKIIKGGSGVWGDVAMSAHPDLAPGTVNQMVTYLLSLSKKPGAGLPDSGVIKIPSAKKETASGQYVLTAAYTDKNVNNIPGTRVVKRLVLNSPKLSMFNAFSKQDVMDVKVPNYANDLAVMYGPRAFTAFRQIDLTGLTSIQLLLSPAVGGVLEIRLDSANGKIIGTTEKLPAGKGSFVPNEYMQIALQSSAGMHDVYIVAQKPDAKRSDISFILAGGEFRQEAVGNRQ